MEEKPTELQGNRGSKRLSELILLQVAHPFLEEP
jgi:hypothetical protein